MVDCRGIANEIAAGRLSDDEMNLLFEELEFQRRIANAKDGLRSIDEHMFDVTEQMIAGIEQATAIEKRNRYINIIRKSDLKRRAAAAYEATDDVSMGLTSASVGVNTPFFKSRDSVDAGTNSLIRIYLGGMAAELKRAGLRAKYNSGQYSRDIARELWDLSLEKPTGKATKSADAKAMAAIIHKYQRASIERENRAGAYIRYKSGYVVRQTHEPRRMERAGFDGWSQEIAPRLDWDTMGIAPEDRGRFLRSVYDAQVTGVRLDQPRPDESDVVFAFKGSGNLAKKESQHRVLLFRSADDWFDYNEKFGQPLNEAIAAGFHRSAQATALMDNYGTNPRLMFDEVRKELLQKYRDGDDPHQVRRLERSSLDWEFAEVSGEVNRAGNATGAAIGRGARALVSMAKLGGSFISSWSDIAGVMSERRYQGRSVGGMITDALTAGLSGLTASGDKRHVADLIAVGIDGQLGDAVSRFAAQDDVPGKLSKTMGIYFKLNLQAPWTDAHKRGVGLMMARDLAMRAHLSWADLDDVTARNLGMYGVTSEMWDLARTGGLMEADGRSYMVPNALPEATGYMSKKLRDRTSYALSAYINDRVDFAIPTPGARERAILRFGFRPGTLPGEAIRFMTQFKSFPVTINQKVLGRELYGHGAKTIRDALLRGQGDLLGVSAFIAASTAMGLISLQAKQLVAGKEPREITPATILAAGLQGGGLGIYGDFLLGQTSRFGHSVLDTLAGPGLGIAADADKIRSKIMAGEDVWAETLQFAKGNLPNLFYTKVALDYLVWFQLQEMVNPGYLRRMERSVKRDTGQEYFLPPSRAVNQ